MTEEETFVRLKYRIITEEIICCNNDLLCDILESYPKELYDRIMSFSFQPYSKNCSRQEKADIIFKIIMDYEKSL